MFLICVLAAPLFAQQPADEEAVAASAWWISMWIPKGRRWPLSTPLFHDNTNAKIVGIEAGTSAFREPPMYDPKHATRARNHRRVQHGSER